MDPLMRERMIYPSWRRYYPTAGETLAEQIYGGGGAERLTPVQRQQCHFTSAGRLQCAQGSAALMRPASSCSVRREAYYRPAAVFDCGGSVVPSGASTAAAAADPAAYDYRDRLQVLMARQQRRQHDALGDSTTGNTDGSRTGAVGCSSISPTNLQQQHMRVAAEPRAPFAQQHESAWTRQQQLTCEQQRLGQLYASQLYQSEKTPHHAQPQSQRPLLLGQQQHLLGAFQGEDAQERQQPRFFLHPRQQQWDRDACWSEREESGSCYVQPQSVTLSEVYSPAVTQDYYGAADDSCSHGATALYSADLSIARASGNSTAAAAETGDSIEGARTFAGGFHPSEGPCHRRRRPSADADAAGGAAAAAASEGGVQQVWLQQRVEKIRNTAGHTSQGEEFVGVIIKKEKQEQHRQEQQPQHALEQLQHQQQAFMTYGSGSKSGATCGPVAADGHFLRPAGGRCAQSALLQPQQQRETAEAQRQLLQPQTASTRSTLTTGFYPLNATALSAAAGGAAVAVEGAGPGAATAAGAAGASDGVRFCWPSYMGCGPSAAAVEDAETLLLQQRPPPPGMNTLVDLDEQLRQQKQQGLSIPRLPSFVSVVSPTQRAAAVREAHLPGASFVAGSYAGRLQPQQQQLQRQQRSALLQPMQEKVRVVPYEEYLRAHVQAAAAGTSVSPVSSSSSSSSLQQQRQSRGRSSSRALRAPQKKAVIVGCNYHVTQQYHLQGSANDAHLFASACVEMLGFLPQNICLLCDHLPSSCYRVGGGAGAATPAGAGGMGQQERKEEQHATGAGSTGQEKKNVSEVGQRGAQQQHASPVSSWGELRSRSAGELLLQGDVKQAAAAAAGAAAAGIASFWGGLGDASSKAGAGSSPGGGGTGPVVHSIVDVDKIEATAENPFMNELPTRQNILKALNWLVRDAKADDHLIFYYSGHSVQVDNMAGWEGEGYEEAIVPCDFDMQDIRDGQNCSLLTMVQLRQLLLSIPAKTHLTIVLDCCGGQTILDPAGTLSPWTFIKGVKQRGLWPLATDATDKMHRAVYRREVWADPDMQKQLVRPRYMPGVEVQSVAALVDPLYEAPLNCRQNFVYKAFCLAGAPWGTCGVEAIFPSVVVPRLCSFADAAPLSPAVSSRAGASVIHGVFTWSLVTALVETLKEPLLTAGGCSGRAVERGPAAAPWAPLRLVTYKRLLERTRRVVSDLKWNRLFKLDQHPDLTIHTGGGGHVTDTFCALPRQQQQQSRSASRRASACVAAAPEGGGAAPGERRGDTSAAGAAGAAAATTSTRDLQQQLLTGRAYPFISAERAWQQVTEASLRDVADRKDCINVHLPYTAADCYRRAFPSAASLGVSAVGASAAAGGGGIGGAGASASAADAAVYVGEGAAGQGQQPAAASAAASLTPPAGPVLQTAQLQQFHPGNAPAYISMQQQQQSVAAGDTAAQLLGQLKQQERVLQQQQLQQQQQRALHQQRLQEQRVLQQRLQQQVGLEEQRLEQLQQQHRLQQQQRVQHQQMQWQQQQQLQHQLQQQQQLQQLEQQKQCVIARLSPAAGEQLLWRDFSTVVYV